MDHRLEFESRKLLHSCPSLSINLQNYNLRVGTLTLLSKFKYQPADSLKIVTLMALFKFLLIQCLEMNPAFQQIATHMVACRGNRTGWWARGSTGFLYRRSLPLKKYALKDHRVDWWRHPIKEIIAGCPGHLQFPARPCAYNSSLKAHGTGELTRNREILSVLP